MPDRDRRGAEKRGRRAETLAVWWLRAKGYTILAQRFKRPVGEIDIIARKGQTVVFIEVKQRPRLEMAQNAVPDRAWRRIARAAEIWATTSASAHNLAWRFDLIAVPLKGFPKHFRDYWRP